LDGGSNSRKLAELEQRKEASNQLQNRYKQHKRERGRLQEDIKRAETELRAANEPVSRKQEELHRAQNRLQELTRDRGQQQTGFSDRMPMLLRAIQQETTFSRQPVGPLGNHMRLLKPQWSSVLENTFGGTLSSFVVTSKQDMNTLSKLMQKVKWWVSDLWSFKKQRRWLTIVSPALVLY
jgi:ATP-dependent RNA helicase DDX6/DHH1